MKHSYKRAARRAIASAYGRSWGTIFVYAWLATCAVVWVWDSHLVAGAAILFGIAFALPGLYILVRSARQATLSLARARLVSATLVSWSVHPLRPDRLRYPLALTTHVVELRLDGGAELGGLTASIYRGIRSSVRDLEEGRELELFIEDRGPLKQPLAVRWPSGRWYGTRGLDMQAALVASRRY